MDMKNKLQQVPCSPGIYVMKAARDRVIYVGKAKNLRNRLRSYFRASPSLDARKSKMLKEIRDFDYIVTENELEALVLEATYIKKTKPAYNIVLRDDKSYPLLKLTVTEQWPRLEVVRRITKDDSLYFGPYVPSGSMREILKFIRRNFPLRTCRDSLKKPFRPCVQFEIGRCLGPCDGDLREQKDKDRYIEVVNETKLFLRGVKKELLTKLQKKMKDLSDDLQYEEAAVIRDRLEAIKKAWESQRVISSELGDLDVIGLYREEEDAAVFMLFIRNGMVIGQKDFFLQKLGVIDNRELAAEFIERFYSKEIPVPPVVILPFKIRLETQRLWLSEKRGKRVRLGIARSGPESGVLKMAMDNACHSFLRHKETKTSPSARDALISLKNLLNLDTAPARIEAVDVSNISGTEAVGAVIVWEDGSFIRDDYRLYRIKTVKGSDDFAMIGEVVSRHFNNLDKKAGKIPDVLLIDGGKGQLSSALKAVKPFAFPVRVAAIAKAKAGQPDRLFVPKKSDAIVPEPFAPSTHLLQKIRDEVHRTAVNYHKKLRAKRVLKSPLEGIRGIGKTRRLSLLKHFSSIDAIRKASVDEIASVKGLNTKTAEVIKKSLDTTRRQT